MANVETKRMKRSESMNAPEKQVFDSEEQVAEHLASHVSQLSQQFIQENGSFTVALSGGTLINALRKLLEPPYVASVEWSKWLIFFLDERVVPLNDPLSNYKLAYDHFLSKVPIPSSNVYTINPELSVEAAADDYEARLKQLVDKKVISLSEKSGFPKLDLILTDIGPEGHIASLFCWEFQRYEKNRWITCIKTSPKPPPERITFTFPLINSSSYITVVVTGTEVADAVKVVLSPAGPSIYIPLPVQKLKPEGTLTWFLDKDASSELPKNTKHLCSPSQPDRSSMAAEPSQVNAHQQQVFDSEEQVADNLASYISQLSTQFIAEHGCFSVVLSGGTLIHTLRKLLEPPYIDTVEWSKWLIFFLDERVVPLNHPESNYKLAYDLFLSKVPIPYDNIYAINDKLSTEAAADDYESRIKQLVDKNVLRLSTKTGFPKLDLMLLGMGPDGHVASLFCWEFQRYEKKRWVTYIKTSPKPPPERITFTFPFINSSSHVALVVTGDDAADAVKVTFSRGPSHHIPLPVQKVKPEGTLKWFLDKDAASELNF